MQSSLRTPRLLLEPLADEHLPSVVELNSDPEVLRYLHGRALTAQESAELHATWLGRAGPVAGLGIWAGFAPSFVGVWMLTPPTSGAREGDLGYRLLRRHWRLGYASEGARELLRYGFEELGLERITAQTMAVNTASRATMASIGMTLARTYVLEFDDPLPGTEQGEVEYELLRSTWLASRR
jgi:RimJ/RimL family protein N-acetyltransferase